MLFLGEGFIPSPTPSRGLDLGGYSSVKSWILTQNQHLKTIDFHWFRMRHPSKMEILELSQGGSTESVMSLKTAFSHEASSENCSRKHAFFRFFIFFEILKPELSPTRELDFSCFQNCIGLLSNENLRNYSFTMMPALFWRCSRAYNTKPFFLKMFENHCFSNAFCSFLPSRNGPRTPLDHPFELDVANLVPSCPGEPPGALKSTQNRLKN